MGHASVSPVFVAAVLWLLSFLWPASSTACGAVVGPAVGGGTSAAVVTELALPAVQANVGPAPAPAAPGDQPFQPPRDALPSKPAIDVSSRRRLRRKPRWYDITWHLPVYALNLLGLAGLLHGTIKDAAERSVGGSLRDTVLYMFENLKLPILMAGSMWVVTIALVLRRKAAISLSRVGEGLGALLCVIGLATRNKELSQTGILLVVCSAVVGATFEISRLLHRLKRQTLAQFLLTMLFFLLAWGLAMMNPRTGHAQDGNVPTAAAYNNSIANIIHASASEKQACASLVLAHAAAQKSGAETRLVERHVERAHLENQVLRTTAFFEKRQIRVAYLSHHRQQAISSARLQQASGEASPVPPVGPTMPMLRAGSNLVWPRLLAYQEDAALRSRIEEAWLHLASDGAASTAVCGDCIISCCGELGRRLHRKVAEVNATDFVQAKRFLEHLASAVHRPGLPAGNPLSH